MAKVRTPNQKNRYRQLNKRLAGYVLLVEQIYDELNLEAAQIALSTGYDGSKPFHFKDYPKTRDRVNKLKKEFVEELHAVIYRGTSDEWKQSNLVQDLLADRVLKAYGATHRGKKNQVYYQVNSDALQAFQERKISGMNLSGNLWNQAANYREELEYAISSAIQKGTSAVTLSKRLSKYLKDFPSLQKDYTQKFGKAVDCHDCEYRSIRLARSEINMSYRTAEQTRWKQMDFVVGYKIKLSAKHPCHDICDMLAGDYPKDFFWTGWHPNDMCYLVPILNTEEEFWSDSTTSVNEVKDVPEGFKKWVKENADRLENAKIRGTQPYFIKDNQKYVEKAKKATENIVTTNDAKKIVWSDKDKKLTGIDILDSNIVVSEKISVNGLAEYDKVLDKIKMKEKDFITLKEALVKIENGVDLTQEDVSIIRLYSHERQHQLDKNAFGGGIGQQDIQRILEANNEIRSWHIASRITGVDMIPKSLVGHDYYAREVASLLQVGEVLGIDRSDFINALTDDNDGGIIGAYRALSKVSGGKINEQLANKILEAVFISDDNYRYYKSKGFEVYNRTTIVKLLNKLKLGRNGKKVNTLHFTPIDYVRAKKVSFTISEMKTYMEYFS